MGQTPSSPPAPPATFSEHEIPTRARATVPVRRTDHDSTPARSAAGNRTRDAEAAMGEAVDSTTTTVPRSMLEAALAESRGASAEEKSGARQRRVDREAFSVHEAETKKASGIQLRRALASVGAGAEVDQLLANAPTVAAMPAQPDPPIVEVEAEAAASPVERPKRSAAMALVLVLVALLVVGFAALLVVGKGSPRAGLAVVRGKLTAR